MSSEWPITPLSDLITVKHGFAFKGEFFSDEPSPFQLTTPGNFAVGGGFQLGKGKYYSGPIFSDYVLRQGDLIVTMTDLSKAADTLGFSAIVPETRGTTWLHNQRVGRVLIKSVAQVHKDFLHYLMRTNDYRQWVVSGATGSTVKHTSPDRICTYQFPLPPLNTQRAIAEALSALDNRITLLRETNATLEDIAQALFKSWFVDFDPVRAKAERLEPEGMDAATAELFPDSFEESELGLLPAGWEVRPIGKLVEGIYDGPHATPAESESGPIFLGIKNLTGTRLELANIRRISENDWSKWTRRIEPTHGDIVFSYEATLGFFAVIPPEIRCCLGRRLALIRPHTEDGAGLFWFHQFISIPFQQMLDKHTIHGATVNRIALKAFPSYSVLNPPEALKLAFNDLVEPLWATIHSNQAHLNTLTQLRDTLLPRLISGQLRLPETEAPHENMLSEAF